MAATSSLKPQTQNKAKRRMTGEVPPETDLSCRKIPPLHRRTPTPMEEVLGPISSDPARSPLPATTESPAGSGPYTNFNTALNAGLLKPMSPPPLLEKSRIRSSPTLFEMMYNDDCPPAPADIPAKDAGKQEAPVKDGQAQLEERLGEMVGSCSPGNRFHDASTSDVKLSLTSRDGLSISLNVHGQILAAHSRFFAGKYSDRWSHKEGSESLPHVVEICDCDNVDNYMETVRLMYCNDLRRKLMKEDVSKVLGILKVSATILFDAGVLSCLEYLEAAPWPEEEEENIASILSQLHLEAAGTEVLKRLVSSEPLHIVGEEESENVMFHLLQSVLQGKDDKARRDLKALLSKMLKENPSRGSTLSKESLYSACESCLQLLQTHLLGATEQPDLFDVNQISRQADNLHWILDILIDRNLGEEFTKTWASQGELAVGHSRLPAIHRYEVSWVTARLFVGIGKGKILVSKDVRGLLLKTWLEPFYEDFGWMRRACRGVDRNMVEDGLSNTILTLPLMWQQEILLKWFERFLNSGEECPNIQRAFEVWWRRMFRRRANGQRLLTIVASSEN